MNNDIWEFHDWIIDQKNNNKVNENDADFIISHIKNNYCPNLENIYVQEKLISDIDKKMAEIEWETNNFWNLIAFRNGEIPYSIYYKVTGKLLDYLAEIENISDTFNKYGISYKQNIINTYFTGLNHWDNTDIIYTSLTDEEDFLIIFYNYEHKHMYIFDNALNGYGYVDNLKEAIKIINKFEDPRIKMYKGNRLNNVINYYFYLQMKNIF